MRPETSECHRPRYRQFNASLQAQAETRLSLQLFKAPFVALTYRALSPDSNRRLIWPICTLGSSFSPRSPDFSPHPPSP
ncbi:unnamed protein product [Protopolystoma xenopodis]|uniref:Uncharacterized protein n=1 Tax=Protopolystoma xenopodis TaxID=117903 RepID=A0A3S5BU96_9PLAT|nr:unnamed protein product [Protopolystoma xenopodis]